MTGLTGVHTLVRLILRREPVRILVWTVAIPALVLLTAVGVKGLYSSQADLDEAAAASEDNAAAIAFNGPVLALDTLGGQVAFQIGSFGMVTVALMTIFTIGRHTRAEEEAGRTELVRAMAVGRHATAAAATAVAVAMNLVVGTLVAAGLTGLALPAGGAVLFGASLAALGLLFAAITLVVAQVSENSRVVTGVSGAVLGAAYVLRAAGDIGDGTLSWFSPIGLAQKSRPFADERWWPLLAVLACAVVLVAVAGVLAERRDLGAGLVPPRPGPPAANPALGRPFGLALRLQRGGLIGWSAGMFLTGFAYGWVADDVEDFVGDNEALREAIAQAGVTDLTDSYLARSLLMVALIGTGFAVQAVLRLRGEESDARAEPVLATAVSRGRWVMSHVAVALLGSVAVSASAGLGVGLPYAATTHDLGQVSEMLGAALAYTPAMWVFVGLAVALFGAAPRAAAAAWPALTVCVVIGLLGQVLDFPAWFVWLSPFEHLPQLPAETASVGALAATTALAAALTAAGLAAFRRRDVG